MKRLGIFAIVTTLTGTLLLVACGGGGAPNTQPGLVRSAKARVQAPNVTGEDRTSLTQGNQELAFDLYRVLRTEPGNLFYSPHSISVALAMTYAGARSTTAEEMTRVLHFTLPPERLHAAFNDLDLTLASRGGSAGFRLKVTNAIWGAQGLGILPAFLDVLAESYGAGLGLLDFEGATEASRKAINDWVSRETEDKIQDLLQPGTIQRDTRLVLTNAIYFRAKWRSPFDPDRTAPGTFRPLAGGTITVPMMRQDATFGFASSAGVTALELAYEGEQVSMLLLVPDAGRFAELEASLNAGRLREILALVRPSRVDLTMPKFSFRSSLGLKQRLESLGMEKAFSDAADLSGITGLPELKITDVVHQAFVLVNEAGTEAAAATGVIIGPTSAPPQVVVDRPFVFLVRDIPTGAVLFAGRVVNPAE